MALNKTLRNILVAGVIMGLVVGAWAVWYVFYKPHRDVGSETAKYELTSQALTEAFKSDTTAFKKYVDQAILVSGPVTSVEGNHLALGNIICSMDSTQAAKLGTIKNGDAVKVQGRLTTYNDLMEEISLDNCVFK